jgi:hypothetical protein
MNSTCGMFFTFYETITRHALTSSCELVRQRLGLCVRSKGGRQKENVMNRLLLYELYRLFREGGCNAVKQGLT